MRKLKDTLELVDAKDKEIRSSKATLTVTEDQTLETREETQKLQKDNDVLQSLLEKYKGDASFHKKVRDNEVVKKLEIEQEKKRLEREVLDKEIETRNVKKELEKVQEHKEILLDSHYQMNQELDALKEHAELLESQNKNVQSIVITYLA